MKDDPFAEPEPEDDGKVWGFLLADGSFRQLPKRPLLLAGFTRAPFDVQMPSGEMRHVVEQPTPEQRNV